MYRDHLKRLFDVIAVLATCWATLPLMVAIAICVWVRLGTPILFRQYRPGLGGVGFEFYKFRTMSNERNSRGELLSDSERLSSFGRFLRSTSLDELPSIFNVLVGDMSLVGPRPLLMEYLQKYDSIQARRHEVRPGITGLAQVKGRNLLSWSRKFEYDVEYVDSVSFIGDLKILLLTTVRVLDRSGISADGHDTMPPFQG